MRQTHRFYVFQMIITTIIYFASGTIHYAHNPAKPFPVMFSKNKSHFANYSLERVFLPLEKAVRVYDEVCNGKLFNSLLFGNIFYSPIQELLLLQD